MKTAYSLVPLILLVTVLFTVSCDSGEEGEVGTDESRTPIAGYELEPRDLSRVVRVSAPIETERPVTISSRMEGLVVSMAIREGDRLDRGDRMLEFDIEELEAQRERALAAQELAEARYERNRQLLEQEAISMAEYEESRAEKRMADSELNLLETRIGFGTVRAPRDLVVLERFVEEGDAVGLQDPLFRVADLDELIIRVGVPERDVVHMETGDPAEFTVDAFDDRRFQGVIERIHPAANPDSRLVTVEISMDPEQKDVRIRPGYLARVTLQSDRREGILAIPSEALLASDPDEPFVFIINEEDRLERRNVETGIERRNWTQILGGLKEGDVIVGGNPGNLNENLPVTVTRWVDEDSPETAGGR